jgi:transcription initiation factor TFIID subunit 7
LVVVGCCWLLLNLDLARELRWAGGAYVGLDIEYAYSQLTTPKRETHSTITHSTPSSFNSNQMNNQQLKANSKTSSTKLRLKVPSNQDKNHQSNSNSTDDHHQDLGISNYLQGYDRELDSDQDEPIGFEEQFILKLPESLTNESNKLRELVESRKEINSEQQNIYFKFKDSRRGIFNIGDKMFGMKLVDLPCVIESQKTFDNKHMFKIADICQVSHQTKKKKKKYPVFEAYLSLFLFLPK